MPNIVRDTRPPAQKKIWQDASLYLLIFSNLFTIFFAVRDDWSLITIAWVYWFQSVSMGVFNLIRILRLKEFSTENYKINKEQPPATLGTKLYSAVIFFITYGFLHLLYIEALLGLETSGSFGVFDEGARTYVYAAGFLFFLNHLITFFLSAPKDTAKQRIGDLMFYPFVRVLPMHLLPFIALQIAKTLPIFLLIKTVTDATLHIIERHVLAKHEVEQI